MSFILAEEPWNHSGNYMFQSGKYVLGRRREFFLLQYLKLCDTFKIPEKLSLDGGAGWSCEPFKPDFYILALHITGIAGFIKVPSSQYTVKFLVWVPVFHMLKIFFSFAMFEEVTEHLCTDGSRVGILVIPVTYFVLTQEIAFLLWLLPSEELWISRGYEVCAAATMEPDGHQAGIFHLAFYLQEMIFPGMMHNLWVKVGDRSRSFVLAVSKSDWNGGRCGMNWAM